MGGENVNFSGIKGEGNLTLKISTSIYLADYTIHKIRPIQHLPFLGLGASAMGLIFWL